MHASLRLTTTIGLVAGLVAVSGCAADRHSELGQVSHLGGLGQPASPGPVASPVPAASIAAAAKAGVTGDLGLSITGGCVMAKDGQGRLWLRFGVTVNWLGTTGFPPTAYQITGEGAAAGSTPVAAAGGQMASVSGEPAAFLGKSVKLTATVDPQRRIPEVNEGNNTASVTITVPATAPADTREQSVPCTNG